MGRLTGKVAIVTGAASRSDGIGNGAATAILFAREGARVVLVNRDRIRAEALEKQIRGEGGKASAFAADVTQPDASKAMAAFAVERYSRLDILHNNVGIGGPETAETVDLAAWEQQFDTNLTSALLSCRSCIARMRACGGGSIINVSSTAVAVGLQGSTGAVGYVVTKSGLQGMTLSLAAITRPRASEPTAFSLEPLQHRLLPTSKKKAASAAAKLCPCKRKEPDGMSVGLQSTWQATSRDG